MSDLLERRPRGAGSRRSSVQLAYSIAALFVVALVWRGVGPAFVDAVAISSVGHPARKPLLAAAVNQRYPELAVQSAHEYFVSSSCDPENGYVMWPAYDETTAPGYYDQVRWFIADRNLEYVGSVFATSYTTSVRVREGRHDALVVSWSMRSSSLSVFRGFVVRVSEQGNRLLALVEFDRSRGVAANAQLSASWKRVEGDGDLELKFSTYTVRSSGWMRYRRVPGASLARLAWDDKAGALRITESVADGSIRIWIPPEEAPFRFEPDQRTDELFAELWERYFD